jgi:hypothetical protein
MLLTGVNNGGGGGDSVAELYDECHRVVAFLEGAS